LDPVALRRGRNTEFEEVRVFAFWQVFLEGNEWDPQGSVFIFSPFKLTIEKKRLGLC
jgi:hypothetical protein